MSFAPRQTVIHQGRKWIVTAVPDALQRHELYNLAMPDPSGRIGKRSETRVNVHARELQREVDLRLTAANDNEPDRAPGVILYALAALVAAACLLWICL